MTLENKRRAARSDGAVSGLTCAVWMSPRINFKPLTSNRARLVLEHLSNLPHAPLFIKVNSKIFAPYSQVLVPTLILIKLSSKGGISPTPSTLLLLMTPSLLYNSTNTSARLNSAQTMDPVIENFEAMFDMDPDWFEKPPVPAKDVKNRLPPSSLSSSSSQLLSIRESIKEVVRCLTCKCAYGYRRLPYLHQMNRSTNHPFAPHLEPPIVKGQVCRSFPIPLDCNSQLVPPRDHRLPRRQNKRRQT